MAVPRTPPPFGRLPGSPSPVRPAPDFIIGIPIAAHHRRRHRKEGEEWEKVPSPARPLARGHLRKQQGASLPLSLHPSLRSNHRPLSFSISPIRTWNRKFFPSAAAAREDATPGMGNKGSFCEQDAPSSLSLSPKGRRKDDRVHDGHTRLFISRCSASPTLLPCSSLSGSI